MPIFFQSKKTVIGCPMNRPAPISSPAANSKISSLFLVKEISVDHLKPPLSMLIVDSDNSIPRFWVLPTLVVKPPKPVELGSGCGANKSEVVVTYYSKLPETLPWRKAKSNPALAVVEVSHLRSGLPIVLGMYPNAALSPKAYAVLAKRGWV